MNASLSLKDLAKLKAQAKKYLRLAMVHAAFAALLIVLLTYSFMVWRINHLAADEPSQAAEDSAISGTRFPKIDAKAITNIQELENNSSQIHSLFDAARNNPFQE